MLWTQRMNDVAEAIAAWRVEHGSEPSLRQLGPLVGVSAQRVRQLRFNVERWNRIPHEADDHVKRWRKLFMDAARAIEQAAKRAGGNARSVQRPPKPRKRQQDNAHVFDYWHQQTRLRWAEQRCAAEERQAERRQRAEQMRLELQRNLDADPRLQELDRMARNLVRKGDHR